MTKKVYFENLDGLRFLCFLSVFFYHSFYTEFDYIKSSEVYMFLQRRVFSNGNLGVNFFFVLSGFLITYLMIEEKKLNKKINVRFFWVRRILRIWPLYYFCVAFGFFAFPFFKTLFGEVPNETASLTYYLAFLSNFDFIKNGMPDSSILSVLWSVGVEEQFYFVWPVILSFIPIKHFRTAFLTVIVISIGFRFLYQSEILYERHTLSCIGDMAIGALGAWLILEKSKFKERIVNTKKINILFLYIIFGICFFFRKQLFFDNILPVRILERAFIAIVILFIILEQCFSVNSLFKMSKFKTISYLGTISYGLYCLHFIGILVTTNLTKVFNLNTELWQVIILETTVALGLTICISVISYKFYEKPFLKLKDRFAFITKG